MNANDLDRPENQQRYRYWVEIRDLRDGSVRNLPLHAQRLVHLSRKRGEPPHPDQQLLRLQDDNTVIEAQGLDALATQLRSRYPDETHERRLHWERDREAEQRYANALDALSELVVEACMNDLLPEQTVGGTAHQLTQ
jgi:PAS domain-containing protein